MYNQFLMNTSQSNLLLLIGGLIGGSLFVVGLNMQSKQKVEQYGVTKNFFHPYMQAALKGLAYSLMFLVIPFTNRKYQKPGITQKNPACILIPISLEMFSNCCYFTALNFIPASIFVMLKGSVIFVTYFLSVCCLKTQIKKQKVIGCLVVFLGLVIVGLVNFIFHPQTKDQSVLIVVSYLLILVGVGGIGCKYVYEEHIIINFSVDPYWLVGIKGLYCILISLILIPLISMVSCPFGAKACVINDQGKMVLETFGHTIILIGFILFVISLVTYNVIGANIAKNMGSLARSVVDISTSLVVWIIGLVVTYLFGQNDPSFRWESLKLPQVLGQSLGFGVLIYGNLLYYEVVLPFWSQNESSQTNSLIQNQKIQQIGV